jgi:hypothetical protein
MIKAKLIFAQSHQFDKRNHADGLENATKVGHESLLTGTNCTD